MNKAASSSLVVVVEAVVVATVAFLLGYKPLTDLDLGWHVSGGLWIIDHGMLPKIDPFAAGGRGWVNYSWLPELLFGWCFRAGGFSGLQALQTGLVVFFLLFLFFIYKQADRSSVLSPAPVLAFFSALVLVSPVLHLRPQLISLVFFAAVFGLAGAKKLTLAYLLPLTVVWANIHVFWIILPLQVFLLLVDEAGFRRAAIRAAVLFAAGLLNPYGPGLYRAVFNYAFSHHTANALIKEFACLSPQCGLLFWFYLALVLLFCTRIRSLWRYGRGSSILLLTWAVLGAWQIKFVPLFGVAAGYYLAAVILPQFFSRFEQREAELRFSAIRSALLAAACGGFVLLCSSELQRQKPLEARTEALLRAAAGLAKAASNAGRAEFSVLNDFNDAGWIILGFRLGAAGDSPAKVAVDGRTLVMGEDRLREFQNIFWLKPGWCRTLAGWDTAIALLPSELAFAGQLAAGKCGEWKEAGSAAGFLLLERNSSVSIPQK